MGELKSYSGSCHCGKVSYDVKLDLDTEVMTCNCSLCGRQGTMLTFVGPDQFTLKSGEDVLTDYQFGSKNIHHLFCSVCGVKSFGRGTGPHGPMVAVNARCLHGVDPSTLQTKHFDGRSL